ncbi:MAG: tetratricopeptide repeat protein [Acidobacteriaceae bacterium]
MAHGKHGRPAADVGFASGESVPHPKRMDKIAMLSEILQQNPKDAFARYGLAMAYAADGKNEEALREFVTTTEYNPDYVPAYQMSAQTLVKMGEFDGARTRLQAGLAACERTGNTHAASEMQVMLDEIAEL